MSRDAAAIGLTEAEAQARLRAEGFNDLPKTDHRTFLRIIGDVLREPMFALLLGAGVIYLVLGDLTEALMLLVFATISVSITVVQELRSERVLEALRDMTSPRALVIRDGVRKRIPGREVVRGDAVVVLEGDRVPADAVLVAASNLLVDESLLTGEVDPVRKSARRPRGAAMARPGGEDLPFVFSGTLVVRRRGRRRSCARPARRARSAGSARRWAGSSPEPPRLQQQTRRLVRNFAVVGMAASLLAVLLYGFLRGDWLQAILGGIALGMSMLPEEFPLVLTAFMVMGAWRLSQARVLTRRAAAIEMLGSATVLCTDKTGTLTENRMTIAELRTPAAAGDQARLCRNSACWPAPGSRSIRWSGRSQARRRQACRGHGRHLCRPGAGPAVRVAPRPSRHDQCLAPARWRDRGVRQGSPRGDRLACAVSTRSGSPGCTRPWTTMAREGVRVLGVARAAHPEPRLPGGPDGICLRIPRPDRLHRPAARQRAGRGTRMPLGRRAGRHDHRRLSGDRPGDRGARRPRCRGRRQRRGAGSASTTPLWRNACEPSRSLPASCPSRSCASSRCSRRTARSSP